MLSWLLKRMSGEHKPLKPGEPAAEAILSRVVKTYASCSTYSDRGTMVAHDGDPATERVVEFTTRFRRGSGLKGGPEGSGSSGGGCLKFHHHSHWTDVMIAQGVVWTRSLPRARHWTSIKAPKVRERDACEGLAAEQGVSFGAAGLIIPMLCDAAFDGWVTLLRLDGVRVVATPTTDESVVLGRECDVIEGDERGMMGGGVVRVSVCRRTGLLLRVARTGRGAKAKVDNWVAVLDATANDPIRDDEFEFTPPSPETLKAEQDARREASVRRTLGTGDDGSCGCGQRSCA